MKKLSSRSLALASASGYLVVSILIGTALVTTQKQEPRALNTPNDYNNDYNRTTAWPTVTTRTTRTTRTTTTTTEAVDYRLVSGPSGLVTAIPNSWTVSQGDVATVQIARSSAWPGFELRFGGAPPENPQLSLFQRISAAHEAKTGKNSYSMESLRDTTLRGYPSVKWSYTTAPNGVAQFCTGAWWEANGVEYVLFVVSPPSGRAQAEKMLSLMTTHAKP
ncbi:hypothetical protein [Lentzea flava]|uniref:Fibronectin attachment protein n=1 Tax=Lentzea flava TaxID=103732 RepID=A0ABQ2UGZ9_9PSEU|nr:hypothetical protein [Lentzea flava]MCP2198632.1 hypothetical protein [Lentzea flava]GGU29002.1 hypothetical protein GCM10010178_21410 [Lentzea flava]